MQTVPSFMRTVSLFLLAATALAQSPIDDRKLNLLGEHLAREVRSQTTPIPSEAVRDYAARIGQRLAAGFDAPALAWTFEVISDDRGGSTHEPSALPGGYVFVPAGLFLAARNEAEFAGMLAHAMAHTVQRHGLRITGTSPPSIVMFGQFFPENVPVPGSLFPVQHANETAADLAAARAMASAGWDPADLALYIARLQPEDTRANGRLPARDRRVQDLDAAIRQLPARVYTNSTEFGDIREIIRGLTAVPPRSPEAPTLFRPKKDVPR